MGFDGLLMGLANGLDKGIDSYRDAEKSALEKRRYKNELKMKGYQEDDTGEIQPTDYTKQTQTLDVGKKQREADDYDPASGRSQRSREYARGLIKGIPGLKDQDPTGLIPDSATAHDIDASGLLGKAVTGAYGMEGRKVTADRIGQSIGLRQDTQTSKAADLFDKDPLLQQTTRQRQQMAQDYHTLTTAKTITPQMLNELSMGIANAISGGRSAAVSSQNKVEFDSVELMLKRKQQELSNNPQDIDSPQVKAYFGDLIKRLDDAYAKNAVARAQQIKEGRTYSHNPDAARVMETKTQGYLNAKPIQDAVDPTIDKYAKQYGLPYDQAEQILNKRGYRGQP